MTCVPRESTKMLGGVGGLGIAEVMVGLGALKVFSNKTVTL